MLPRPNRLPSSEISRVMKTGRRIISNGMTLIYKTNTDSRFHGNDKASRFAFIVSKMIDKRATSRNRIKRHLRESVRHIVNHIAHPIDAVVIGRKELTGLPQEEVEKRVIECFHRI